MHPIGGFLEEETKFIQTGTTNSPWHSTPALSTGRACLSLILKFAKPSKVYLPFYCCDTLIDPFIRSGIEYEFYSINEQLEISTNIQLKNDEMVLYINYFGLKHSYVHHLSSKYNGHLIVDNTQDFFTRNIKESWSFNSARKYFGVPDGAYLYPPEKITLKDYPTDKSNPSIKHLEMRLQGYQKESYQLFLQHEASLTSDILLASDYSLHILNKLDYPKIIKQRRENFQYCHQRLKEVNSLKVEFDEGSVPFMYPFLSETPLKKEKLYPKNIFISTFWKEVLQRSEAQNYPMAQNLTKNLIPIPVDHRIDTDNLEKVISEILKLL